MKWKEKIGLSALLLPHVLVVSLACYGSLHLKGLVMGNSADKKYFAELHNKNRAAKPKAAELERLDRIENPWKYTSTRAALHQARLWMSIASGMSIRRD